MPRALLEDSRCLATGEKCKRAAVPPSEASLVGGCPSWGRGCGVGGGEGAGPQAQSGPLWSGCAEGLSPPPGCGWTEKTLGQGLAVGRAGSVRARPRGKGLVLQPGSAGQGRWEDNPSLPTEELHTSLTDAPGQGWPWHTFISMGRLILPPPMSQQLRPQPQPGSGVTAWGSQSHQCSAWSLGASADCGNIPK